MSGAVFRGMLLATARDRGALAMSFLLPAVFFLIFAAIFSGATGEQMRLEVALADEVRSEDSMRLIAALRDEPALRVVGGSALDADGVRDLVRRGTADVGLIVRADAEPLGSLGGFGPAPLLIVADPVRGVAAPMLAGQVQRAYFSMLPDVALGSVVELLENEFLELSDDQREDVETGLADLAAEARQARERGQRTDWGLQDLHDRENVVGQSAASNHVAYYAGAVAVMFLLFSAVHGALSLFDEQQSGILDRVLAGPGSTAALIHGKFLFIAVQGLVQVGVIFVIAWLVHGVDFPRRIGPWAVTTLAASVAAAGMALVATTACRTRRQAQTIANVAILVLSALGGSMVPRFLMPPVLYELGWLTPNAWALEAYTATFWRDDSVSALWLPWAVLFVTGVIGLAISRLLARRLETL